MVILDTNHFSESERDSAAWQRLDTRIIRSNAPAFITVITAEEVMAGWLQRVRGRLAPDRLLKAYTDFHQGLESLHEWNILPWTMEASDIFDEMRSQSVRIGTLDLRIASLALSLDATVLTRNLVDFEQVPGLRVENWLD